MKKSNWVAIIVSLVIVLCVSFGVTYFFLKKDKTYTPMDSLNAGVTEGMKMNEIAEMYVDSCVTVHVETSSPLGTTRGSLGSGVCIAAKEYETASGYKASYGSYFATNYHVVTFAADPLYANYKTNIYIRPNMSEQRYKVELLWSSKDLDVAILYCDEDLKMGWIEMKDRSVACSKEDKLGFSSIFTIGTPLNQQYQNTYSEGVVKNLNLELTSSTVTELYTYSSGGKFNYTTDKKLAEMALSTGVTEHIVFDNAYQDIVMMSCEITNGNSGGGVFDEKGYLIGLSTLGLSYESANTAAINFFVPIYPITLVLDRIIENKETNAGYEIYSPESMGLRVIDAQEASTVTATDSETGEVLNEIIFNGQSYYYFDSEMYLAKNYRNAFAFENDGVYVINNTGAYSQLMANFVITGANKTDLTVEINNRNDLLYFLLSCNKGEIVNFYGTMGFLNKSFSVTL